MKKLILVGILASIASANTCDMYRNDLIEQNVKLQKAIKYELKSEYRMNYKWLLNYSKKVVVESEEGGSRQKTALTIIKQINKMNGVK